MELNLFVHLMLLACLMVSSMWGHASGEPLGVVYPELSDPYNKVFDTIIDGIEQEAGGRIDKYSLEKTFDSAQLESNIKRNGNRVILVLGARSRKAISDLDLKIPLVLGAILPASEQPDKKEVSGISLLPDPSTLFDKLLYFAQYVKIVSVVYNPDNYRSLIQDASESAKGLGLKLDARPARDLYSSARIYKELAETIDGRINAIWLLPDRSTIDSDSILPFLLEEAWNRRLIVFSTQLDYVRRGTLFSMYPDNFQMGRDLGKLAKQVDANRARTGVTGLRSLKTAVNIRTATHLGIDLLSRDADSIDLIFPLQ